MDTNKMTTLMQLLDRLIALRGQGSPMGEYLPQMQTQPRETVVVPPKPLASGSVGGVSGLLQDYLGGYGYGV